MRGRLERLVRQRAPPQGDGRHRGDGVPLSPRHGPQRLGLDPEPGALGPALPLPGCARHDAALARRPAHVPAVFTREEVRAVLSHRSGQKWLMASFLYGSGLRLSECLKLRVEVRGLRLW